MSAMTSALSKPRNRVLNRSWRKSRGLTFIRWSPAGSSQVALPEDGRAEPDNRGSFLHGDFEIVTHAHGQLAQQRLVDPLVQQHRAKGPQLCEVRTRILRILEERRNRHQPHAPGRSATC